MTTPYSLQRRTEQAAALADPGLALKLPVAFTRAVSAYLGAMKLRAPAPPRPGELARLAAADAAVDAFEDAARTGKAPAIPGTETIAAARQREQEATDRAALVAELRTAAVLGLARVADEHQPALMAAIRARFAAAITELTGIARELPPGCDEQVALVQGDPIRARYLRAADLVGLAERLRALVHAVEDAPAHGPAPDLLEQALSYLRVPTIYDRRVDTSGGTPWGPLGSTGFYLGLATVADPADWWLPTVAERGDRADTIVEERRVAKVKAAAGR